MSVAAGQQLEERTRARVRGFAARLRRRHVRDAALAGAARTALLLAVPAVALAFWGTTSGAPRGAAVAAAAGTALVVAVLAAAVVAGFHAAFAPTPRLLAARAEEPARVAGGALARLGDGLLTWLERDATPPPTVSARTMTAWLGTELDRDIGGLPAAALRRARRRPLGRRRWLVALLVLLLLAWLLSLFWQPPWPGWLGGRPQQVDHAGGAGPGAGGAPQPGGDAAGGGGDTADPDRDGEPDGSPPTPESPEPKPDSSPPPEPPPPAPEPVETPDPEAPAPLLQLPPDQRFVVPEYLPDGPSRRMRAHVAEVGGGSANAPSAPAGSERPRGGGEGDEPPPPPPLRREEFERAAERARTARHVPAAERAIVRRFFELLREAAK